MLFVTTLTGEASTTVIGTTSLSIDHAGLRQPELRASLILLLALRQSCPVFPRNAKVIRSNLLDTRVNDARGLAKNSQHEGLQSSFCTLCVGFSGRSHHDCLSYEKRCRNISKQGSNRCFFKFLRYLVSRTTYQEDRLLQGTRSCWTTARTIRLAQCRNSFGLPDPPCRQNVVGFQRSQVCKQRSFFFCSLQRDAVFRPAGFDNVPPSVFSLRTETKDWVR